MKYPDLTKGLDMNSDEGLEEFFGRLDQALLELSGGDTRFFAVCGVAGPDPKKDVGSGMTRFPAGGSGRDGLHSVTRKLSLLGTLTDTLKDTWCAYVGIGRDELDRMVTSWDLILQGALADQFNSSSLKVNVKDGRAGDGKG